MEKKIRTLIIPDVHGRDFWTKPVHEVLKESDANIVFIGDYVDPYYGEFAPDVDCVQMAIDGLGAIIDLKKANPDMITLLIGNHDAGYCIGDDICSSRMARGKNKADIEKLFLENRELFQLALEDDVNGKHIIYSHAGIFRGWANQVWGEEEVNADGFNVVNELNDAWKRDSYGILNALGDYDRYRGWGGYEYGSPVWADIQSWDDHPNPEDTFGFNIVGHTQCVSKPIIFDTIADLDVRRAFYLDDEGNIRDYETDEVQEKTIPLENK